MNVDPPLTAWIFTERFAVRGPLQELDWWERARAQVRVVCAVTASQRSCFVQHYLEEHRLYERHVPRTPSIPPAS